MFLVTIKAENSAGTSMRTLGCKKDRWQGRKVNTDWEKKKEMKQGPEHLASVPRLSSSLSKSVSLSLMRVKTTLLLAVMAGAWRQPLEQGFIVVRVVGNDYTFKYHPVHWSPVTGHGATMWLMWHTGTRLILCDTHGQYLLICQPLISITGYNKSEYRCEVSFNHYTTL